MNRKNVVGEAATVGQEDKVGKWWVQIAPRAGIRKSRLNFSRVKYRLHGAYLRTLGRLLCFCGFADEGLRSGQDRASRKIALALLRKSGLEETTRHNREVRSR